MTVVRPCLHSHASGLHILLALMRRSLACAQDAQASGRGRTSCAAGGDSGTGSSISDYRFLEEAAGLRDSSARDTQRMLQSQKLQQLRQLQTSVGLSALYLLVQFVSCRVVDTSIYHSGGACLP